MTEMIQYKATIIFEVANKEDAKKFSEELHKYLNKVPYIGYGGSTMRILNEEQEEQSDE